MEQTQQESKAVGDGQDETTRGQLDSDEGQPSQPPHQVLDGGWGWVCAVSCCLTAMLMGGLNASFSIIFLALVERFGRSAAVTAWVYSINVTCVMMGGPVAAALITRFGCRRCLAVAGVMYFAGLICTGFAPTLAIIFISLSIVPGVAGSIPYTSVFVIIGEYFDKNRSKAIAIALIGRGIGAIVFPIFLQMLLETFGFTGTFLILGGCFLNIVPLGMLLRSPEAKDDSPSADEIDKRNRDTPRKSNDVGDHLPTEESSEAFELLTKDEKTSNSETIPRTRPKTGCSICTKLLNHLDLKLVKEMPILAFFCHLIFMSLAMTTIACCVAGFAKELGISKRETALCLSAFGIASILARIFAGIVFDLKAVQPHRFRIYALKLLLLSAVVLAVPMLHNLLTLIIYLVLIGIFLSAATNQDMVLLAGLVDKSRYPSAVGLSTAFRGIGMLLGPPIGGLLRDITGSYLTSFLVAGGSFLVSFLIFCTVIVCGKMPCCQKRVSKDIVSEPVNA